MKDYDFFNKYGNSQYIETKVHLYLETLGTQITRGKLY